METQLFPVQRTRAEVQRLRLTHRWICENNRNNFV